jgi:hypothetical protein
VPGRRGDPEFQTLAYFPFELDPAATEAFKQRARRLGVTHFALALSAIFHTLQAATDRDDMLFTIIAIARRGRFDQTIGNFAGVFPLRRCDRAGELTDQNVRLVFPEIMQSAKNYLPATSYSEQFGWWQHRRDIRFTISDVTVNSVPPPIDFESESMRGDYQISPWGLTCRVKPPRAAYYGGVMDFFLEMRGDTLSGLVKYESGIVGPQVVAAVTAALRDTLSREIC